MVGESSSSSLALASTSSSADRNRHTEGWYTTRPDDNVISSLPSIVKCGLCEHILDAPVVKCKYPEDVAEEYVRFFHRGY